MDKDQGQTYKDKDKDWHLISKDYDKLHLTAYSE